MTDTLNESEKGDLPRVRTSEASAHEDQGAFYFSALSGITITTTAHILNYCPVPGQDRVLSKFIRTYSMQVSHAFDRLRLCVHSGTKIMSQCFGPMRIEFTRQFSLKYYDRKET